MTSSGLVELGAIRDMLKHCGGSEAIDERTHRLKVSCNGQDYWLPLGKHSDRGKRINRSEVKRSDVEAMVGQLKIDRDCARRYIPSLRPARKTERAVGE